MRKTSEVVYDGEALCWRYEVFCKGPITVQLLRCRHPGLAHSLGYGKFSVYAASIRASLFSESGPSASQDCNM